MRRFDNTPNSWLLRDRDVKNVARRLREADDIPSMHDASSTALGYLALAAQAGQVERLQQWSEMFGEARDVAFERMLAGGLA